MKYLFTIVSILVVLNCYSQTTDSLKIYNLEEVLVVSTRNRKLLEKTPEVMQVITSKDIELLNVNSTG